MSARDKQRLAIAGGLLTGLGLGSCLAWSLNIFETSKQLLFLTDGGTTVPHYPSTALTVFVVLVASSAFGVGLGMVAAALIRNDDMRHSGAATAADPPDAASSQTT